mmetsp:Transcript_28777/g.63416  ORF Transcript_28777/g.63416 Transcript_28777/m.63416 type:complete len:903 (+) Transcript_28777:134-2842(+)
MDSVHALQEQVEIKFQLPSERKTDVFDKEDFDAIKFINQIYPDESSLGDLDRFIGVLKKQIRTVDKEIFSAVRAQGGAHTRARDDVASAHAQISELFMKIRDIQRKAEESEMMVQEICRDIKKLDYAKKHLTNAITALRRLAMLTAAVTDLEQVAGRRDQYKKCANLLEAITQLMDYFQQYESIPKVKTLSKRLNQVQAKLQESVIDDFKILMGQADVKLTPDNLDRLAAACLVVDALGPRVRDQLMDWLCDREMSIYTNIFSMSGEAGKLDRFERRYMWFKGRLEEKKEQWAIFPMAWRVPQMLCLTFCKITKAHVKRILNDEEAQAELRGDIGPLIKTVVATNKFEKEMAALFGGGASMAEEEEDEQADTDSLTAREARMRLEKFRKRERLEAQRKAMEKMTDRERQAQQEAKTTFEGSISEAFEEALRLYVAEEERDLTAHLETCLREEYEARWSPQDEEPGPRVLSSANKLFLKIRGSLSRCSRMISKGPTLLALTEIFQTLLTTYAAALLHRLPKTATGQTAVQPPYNGQDWYIRVPEDEEKVLCHILHTAEFCRETVEGLSAAIVKSINPALAEKVDMSDQESAFLNVASQCMNVLVVGLNTKLDAGLQEMTRVRWDSIEQPGDDSTFVNNIRKVLLDSAPRLGAELSETSFSFLCDKMARMFVPRFQEHVYRLKKISDKGTLQLSIDCDAVKRVLLDFVKVARPTNSGEEVPNYVHYVEREMGAVINMVKVLQSKPENLVDTFMLLMPAQSQNMHEFVRVCEMKNLTKKQQSDLMALYQHKVSGGDAASAPIVAPAAATNLGAFKLNMNNLTQLAATINFPGRGPKGVPGPAVNESPSRALLAKVTAADPRAAGHARNASGSSITDAMKEKTKEGFAKIGNVVKGLQSWHADVTN